MKVRFTGKSSPLSLVEGKVYRVISTECAWYRIIDESGEDYLYPPSEFEIVEELPVPPAVRPASMPPDMLEYEREQSLAFA